VRAPELPLKLGLPSYVAVTLCVPVARVVVVYFATPPLRLTVFTVVVPSLKVTHPVTVPLNCGATSAVRVADCPKVDGFSDEAVAVAVLAWFTTWLSAADVLVVNELFP
jgi:hypothetical protein